MKIPAAIKAILLLIAGSALLSYYFFGSASEIILMLASFCITLGAATLYRWLANSKK